jgi:hypothetical protein
MAHGRRDAAELRAYRASPRPTSMADSCFIGLRLVPYTDVRSICSPTPDRTQEEYDIQVFMKIVSLLDKDVGLRLIGGLHRQVDALVRDNFASNHCWRQWHRHRVVRGSERATCCVEPPDPRPVLLSSNSHFPPLDHPPRSRGSTKRYV